MKALSLFHPLSAIREFWSVFREAHLTPAMPPPPPPDEPQRDPGTPDPEYPLWTYFIDNTSRKS